MVKYTIKNKPKKEGYYLVKLEEYTESGYLVAEWIGGKFRGQLHCDDITDFVTEYSKRLK